LAEASGYSILAVDYGLAPEHPFPQGLEDCYRAYLWLLENGPKGAGAAENTFILGDSAGGNLALATALKLKDNEQPLPDGLILLSPTVDLTNSGDSWRSNIDTDIMLAGAATMMANAGLTEEEAFAASPYLQGADGRQPYASPINGDLTGLPPMLCLASEIEVLRDDSLMLRDKAVASMVDIRLEVWPHVFHAWPVTGNAMPESAESVRRMARFMDGTIYKRDAPSRFESFKDLSVSMAENAEATPDLEAVVLGDRALTWAEFDKRQNKVANALIGLGIEPGDKVAALSSTSIEYMEIMFGTLRAGACIVPLSSMAASDSLALMVNNSDAKVFFVSQSYKDLIDPITDQLTGLMDGGRIAIDFEEDGWVDYASLVDAQPDVNPKVNIGPDLGFNIIYSSGTTGVPKGILHRRSMRFQEYPNGVLGGYGPTSVTVVSTPLYSNTTMAGLLPTVANGGKTVLMSKFDARGFLELSEQHQATHAMLVPVQYQRIMDVEDFADFDLSTFHMKYSTSAPLRAELKRDILDRWAGGITEYYGLTEGGVTCVLFGHLFPDKLHTVGFPIPGCEIKVMSEDGQELPQGEIGELVGRSLAMMDGYYKAEDKTEESSWYDAEGNRYHRSGDMGRYDEDGFIELLDRKKDMIISGGFNVFAIDLEKVLLAHEDVLDATVIGVPSDQWGETPLGLVVAKPGADVDAIKAWANERLGKGQRISAVELRQDLPRSSIGKVLKRELRAPYWEAVGKAIS
jgi:acyl-CoA synthetase (AMP-forming)/AMP-acid ligase II